MMNYLVYRRFRVVDKLQTVEIIVFNESPAATVDVSEIEKMMKCRLEEISDYDHEVLTCAYLRLKK